MRHADDPADEPANVAAAESIDVNADDDASPFAINVPAYRQELERRQRDADALAVVAAADVRNRAEIVSRPLDASTRLAENAAHAQLSYDAADAEHSVAPVAAAAPEHAAAPAEACAADIVLWESAYSVDIVDDVVVAMWGGMPGLQDDPVAAAAELLATQQADAIEAQRIVEAAGLTCTICYEPRDLQMLDCGHDFCRLCIAQFVSKKCPNCRAPIADAQL
jgi:hypothetical protein